jgi:hypothetical protein
MACATLRLVPKSYIIRVAQRRRGRTISAVRSPAKPSYRRARISSNNRPSFPVLNTLKEIEAQVGHCGHVTGISLSFERCDVIAPAAFCQGSEH